NTTTGDIDGDGSPDIIAGLGTAPQNPSLIAAYKQDGTLIAGSKVKALRTYYGARVAAADFNGDSRAETVVGSGTGPGVPSYVTVYSYTSGKNAGTGLSFKPFDLPGGVNVAAGDVDGDGVADLITSSGANSSAGSRVRVWKVDASKVPWTAVKTAIDFVPFPKRCGLGLATGDINGDGKDEMIVAGGPDPKGGPNTVKVFNGDGSDFGLEINIGSTGYSLGVASADLDLDGVSEIITVAGKAGYPSNIKIYKGDGTLFRSFDVLPGACYNGTVSTGDLGY
ncbi:MAG: VCBS repeat-containing protein, partial [Nitrospirota bacterium]